jgi:hypothetical protein
MGLEKFSASASNAGADGVLIIDITPEESEDYWHILKSHLLDTIFLAAPTSSDDRLQKISAVSSGFLYLISRTGVTGAKDALPDDLPALLRRARTFTNLPIAVGFGISLPGRRFCIRRSRRCCGRRFRAGVRNRKATAADSSASAVDAAAKRLTGAYPLAEKAAARTGLSRRAEVAHEPR